MNQRAVNTDEQANSMACDLPPLRIHHLLSMTAVVVSIIVGALAFDRRVRGAEPIDNPVIIGCVTLVAVAFGVAVVTASLGIYWRVHGRQFPDSAGGRLAVLILLAACGYVLALVLSLAMFELSHDWFSPAWFALRAFIVLGIIAYCLRAAVARGESPWWRLLFGAIAAMPLTVAILGVPSALISTAAILAWAAWRDVRRTALRHWTHWAGVVTMLVLLVAVGTISLYPSEEHWQVSGYF